MTFPSSAIESARRIAQACYDMENQLPAGTAATSTTTAFKTFPVPAVESARKITEITASIATTVSAITP